MSIPPRARPAEATLAMAAFVVATAGLVEVADPPAAVETGLVLVALAVVLKRVVLLLYGVETGATAVVLLEMTTSEDVELCWHLVHTVEVTTVVLTAVVVGTGMEVVTPVT